MTLNSIGAVLLLGVSLLPAAALAQPTVNAPTMTRPGRALTGADLDTLRTEIRASRRETVDQNLRLTVEEAARFWPLYDQYADDLTVIKDAQYQLVAEYVNGYGNYDDKTAMDFIKRWVDLDVRTAALRARYLPLVGQVLPGLKAATFFQIDRRISMEIDHRVASNLSVLQAQDGN